MAAALDEMGALLGGATPDAGELLAQLERDDPRMAAICRLMTQRRAEAIDAPPVEAPREQDDAELDALRDAHARLRRLLSAMRRDLDRLRDRNAMAAAALGACEACWGRDPGCPHCDGRGRPGAEEPDVALYARLVAPAVRRLARDAQAPRVAMPLQPDRAAGEPFAGPLD